MIRRLLVITLSVVSAAFSGYSQTIVEWSQSSWQKNGNGLYNSSTSMNKQSNVTAFDFMYLSGVDSENNSYVFLHPLTNMPMPNVFYTNTFMPMSHGGRLIEEGFYALGLPHMQAYDANESCDGDGSYKYAYAATGEYPDLFYAYRKTNAANVHAEINVNTNIFMFCMTKYQCATPVVPGYFRVYMFDDSAGTSYYWQNNIWPMSSYGWNVFSAQLRVPSTVFSGGTIPVGNRMSMAFDPGRYLQYIGASTFFSVSNTMWFDDVVAAHEFFTNGMVISAPVVIPQYHTNSGGMKTLAQLSHFYISGFVGLTNAGSTNNREFWITNLNYYGPNVFAGVQVRWGDSVDELVTNRWYGPSGVATSPYANIYTNDRSSVSIAAATFSNYLNPATLPGVSNAQFLQYRVVMFATNANIRGVTPVLTNVSFAMQFTNSPTVIIRPPVLATNNGAVKNYRTLTLSFLSNYFDPYITAVFAVAQDSAAQFPLSVLSMTKSPYTSARTVVYEIQVPINNYDVVISNVGVGGSIVLTNAIMGKLPVSPIIDLSTLKRAYKPDNTGTVSFTINLNIAGTRTFDITLYSANGKVIYKAPTGTAVPGINTVTWQSTAQKKLAMGVYVIEVKLTSESGTVEVKRGTFVLAK